MERSRIGKMPMESEREIREKPTERGQKDK
jgi:hypothetical protein